MSSQHAETSTFVILEVVDKILVVSVRRDGNVIKLISNNFMLTEAPLEVIADKLTGSNDVELAWNKVSNCLKKTNSNYSHEVMLIEGNLQLSFIIKFINDGVNFERKYSITLIAKPAEVDNESVIAKLEEASNTDKARIVELETAAKHDKLTIVELENEIEKLMVDYNKLIDSYKIITGYLRKKLVKRYYNFDFNASMYRALIRDSDY
jgi:hypothetical protein